MDGGTSEVRVRTNPNPNPNPNPNQVWMAVHLRWGDVGASEHTLEWYADKTVPLAALTEQTLRVKALLGAARQTRGRTLVVHLFSEISEEQVAG